MRTGRSDVGSASQEIDANIEKPADWRGSTLSRRRGIVLASPGPGRGGGVEEALRATKSAGAVARRRRVHQGDLLERPVWPTFPKGAHIPDPMVLFHARMDSRTLRAIDLRERERVPEAALKALVREAADLRVRT